LVFPDKLCPKFHLQYAILQKVYNCKALHVLNTTR